jgi:hypothetical protein
VPFALDACYDDTGVAVGLGPDDPGTSVEPFHERKRQMLSYAATLEEFLDVWHWLDWNEFRIRIVGAKPTVTAWENDLKVVAVDMAALQAPHYDADDVAQLPGPRGHIAFEVHDNDPILGDGRWRPGVACRWRNVRVKEL